MYLLVCKGLLVLVVVLSNDGVAVARGTIFQEMRPGAVFKTGDFVKEKLGLPQNVSNIVTLLRRCHAVLTADHCSMVRWYDSTMVRWSPHIHQW